MAESRVENFEAQIHDTDYKRPFLENPLTADGLIDSAGREVERLDGLWRYTVDAYDTCRRAGWYKEQLRDAGGRPVPYDYDFDAWDEICVPSCWNTLPELGLYEGTLCYTRTFRYVSRADGERVFLRFGAVQYRATVFLNRRIVGHHDGGSTPFSVEVTDLLEETNRILLVVDNHRLRERVPTDNTDWFNYGGIYRSVELVRVPEAFIRDYGVQLVPGSNYGRISCRLRVDGEASGAVDAGPAGGEARLSIPELGVSAAVPIRNGEGAVEVDAAPELWSPETPRLYDVRIEYGTDSVSERIGFREIRVQDGAILLNGKEIVLRGICYHEDSPELGKTTNEAQIRQTIAHAKEMNANALRLAHYPHTGLFARIADEEGILLWEEIPVYWAIDFGNPVTYTDAENQLRELIQRDRNRASVIIWSVGNENPDTDERLSFMRRLAETARELDPTRPVSAACLINKVRERIEDRLADHLDIIGLNQYLGWYAPDFSGLPRLFENSRPEKPVIVTEFGAGALAGHHGSEDELFTEEKQRAVYRRQVEVMGAIPYIKGTMPWILYDFRCPRRTNRYQRGYNRKGLLAEDRRTKKAGFAVMQEFYRKR